MTRKSVKRIPDAKVKENTGCGRINGKCPKCEGSLQEHFIHEEASLLWCGKCYTAFLDHPANDELTELTPKCKHGPTVQERRAPYCNSCGFLGTDSDVKPGQACPGCGFGPVSYTTIKDTRG